MDVRVKIEDPELLIPPLLSLLDETPSVPLTISGGSMTPFLVHGRDVVYLSKPAPDEPPKRGDMILYRRDNGAYVLHRVLRVERGLYTMLGDAQTCPERGIRPDQVLAVVDHVRRKGVILHRGSFVWDFFEGAWLWVVPLRPVLVRGYDIIKKIIKGVL